MLDQTHHVVEEAKKEAQASRPAGMIDPLFLEEEEVKREADKVSEHSVEKALKDPGLLMQLQLRKEGQLAFAYATVRRSPRHFKFLRAEFREKRYLAKMALMVHPGASKAPPVLSYVGEDCAKDKELVLIAVEYWPMSLQYACPKLQDDWEVVMTAVTNDGNALEFASARLRADKAIALKAVSDKGLALQFVLGELNDDDDVVLKAVEMHWAAWPFAGPRAVANRDTVLRATRMHPDRIQSPLSADPDFRRAVDSSLACEGDHTAVIQAMLSIEQTEEGVQFHCRAFTMSGVEFDFLLPSTADAGVLADRCREEVREISVQKYIHVTLNTAGDDQDEWTPLKPFDARRSLREFFSPGQQAQVPEAAQTQVSEGEEAQPSASRPEKSGGSKKSGRINIRVPPKNQQRHDELTASLATGS